MKKRPFTDEEFNDFIKKIEAQKNHLFCDIETGEAGGGLRGATPLDTAFNTILQYEKYKRPSKRFLETEQEVTDYINALKAVYTVLTSDTKEETKGIIEDMFNPRFFFGYIDPEKQSVKYFFNKREELPQDHPILFRFIDEYIHSLVYVRFYKPEDEARRARGEDPEDYDDNSPEGLKRADMEYNANLNKICKEYGFNNHLSEYDEENGGQKERKPLTLSFLDKRPKEYLDEVYGEFNKQIDEEIKELERLEGDTPTS